MALLVRGDEQPAGAGQLWAGGAQEVEAAAVGQHPVDDGEIRFFAEQRRTSVGDVRTVGDEIQTEVLTDEMGQELPDHRVVLDEHDARWVFFRHGAILPQRCGSMLGKMAKGTGKLSRPYFAGSRAI